MTRDIRNRLAQALERGDIRSAGSTLSPRMRERLERALAGSDREGDSPLPRVYSGDQLTKTVAGRKERSFTRGVTGRKLETPKGEVLQYHWCVPMKELAVVQDFEGAAKGAGVLSVLLETPSLGELDLGRAFYIDTETTGLAGGTGTYVFMLGMGWVEKGNFVVEQLFLRDFSEEAALLHRANQLAGEFDVLVTFNGKRYDLPLLNTRMVMNRLKGTLGEMPHLDLLQPARLLYGGTFDNCRLQTLEKELMGHFRRDDIPGSEIPKLYFDYLSSSDTSSMVPVFEHNFLDVVTLLSLTAHFLHLCQKPELDPRALAGLGRLHSRRGNREQALALMEQARSRRAATYRDLRDLGYLYKRNRDFGKALEVWKALITRQERVSHELGFDATPYVEAAKHYEHKTGDFRRALEFTTAALEQASVTTNGNAPSGGLLAQLNHRANRLRHRLARSNDTTT